MTEERKIVQGEFKGIDGLTGDQKIEMERWQNKAEEYMDNPEKTENLVSRAFKKAEASKENEVIHQIWDKIHLLFGLVRDWSKGNYKSISKSALLTIIAGLIYFVSPIDIVPDWIVGLGLVDDAAVLGLIINRLDKELVRYREWKKSEPI